MKQMIPLAILSLGGFVFSASSAYADDALLANRIGKLSAQLAASKKMDADVVDSLFVGVLMRLPTDAEREPTTKFFGRAADRKTAIVDVLFALVNSKEFIQIAGLDGPDEATAFLKKVVEAMKRN